MLKIRNIKTVILLTIFIGKLAFSSDIVDRSPNQDTNYSERFIWEECILIVTNILAKRDKIYAQKFLIIFCQRLFLVPIDELFTQIQNDKKYREEYNTSIYQKLLNLSEKASHLGCYIYDINPTIIFRTEKGKLDLFDAHLVFDISNQSPSKILAQLLLDSQEDRSLEKQRTLEQMRNYASDIYKNYVVGSTILCTKDNLCVPSLMFYPHLRIGNTNMLA